MKIFSNNPDNPNNSRTKANYKPKTVNNKFCRSMPTVTSYTTNGSIGALHVISVKWVE
jgi:hypothetical protein